MAQENRQFSITVWIDKGVGIEYTLEGRESLIAAIDSCIEDGYPFQVGHTFGDLDGTHPRKAPRMPRAQEDTYLSDFGGIRRGL